MRPGGIMLGHDFHLSELMEPRCSPVRGAGEGCRHGSRVRIMSLHVEFPLPQGIANFSCSLFSTMLTLVCWSDLL